MKFPKILEILCWFPGSGFLGNLPISYSKMHKLNQKTLSILALNPFKNCSSIFPRPDIRQTQIIIERVNESQLKLLKTLNKNLWKMINNSQLETHLQTKMSTRYFVGCFYDLLQGPPISWNHPETTYTSLRSRTKQISIFLAFIVDMKIRVLLRIVRNRDQFAEIECRNRKRGRRNQELNLEWSS